MTAWGHEGRFPRLRLNARCQLRQRSVVVEDRGDRRRAPSCLAGERKCAGSDAGREKRGTHLKRLTGSKTLEALGNLQDRVPRLDGRRKISLAPEAFCLAAIKLAQMFVGNRLAAVI
jgi:hypothetical protein